MSYRFGAVLIACFCGYAAASAQDAFPYKVTDEAAGRELSAAMKRSFDHYPAPQLDSNELYSQFRYTKLEGLDYSGGDGTVSRRDPSKVIRENGKYYVWYTRRQTASPPRGAASSSETVPSTDWDLAEIWYATSQDGFTWQEQGVAVPRPPRPNPGWRSVSTPDVLKFKGKFYLYYQAFLEASGLRGDYCPVSVSSAESADGPWKPSNATVVPTGAAGEWDQFAVHDPYPLVHDGKIYLYYKSAFNRPRSVWVAQGLAIGDSPLGPFRKYSRNPVLNSGHETALFPFQEGVASLTIHDGQEHFTVQYAKDWVNFEIASITELMPIAAGPFVPDAFTDSGNGRGITWGLSHFTNAGGDNTKQHSILTRFDCDLSLDVHDPELKRSHLVYKPEFYYRHGLSQRQRERIGRENSRLAGAEK